MQLTHFDPPAHVPDLGTAALEAAYSGWMSGNFDIGVTSVTAFLGQHGGGTCQFYNPVTHGRTDPDLAASAGDITWNGFPKRFLAAGPGGHPDFAGAEPTPAVGNVRPQDEYLEWFVHKNDAGRITSVDFTCEGWDYYGFLADNAPGRLLELYRTFISPEVQSADLFVDGAYNRTNRWNTQRGAMHLTHSANNLFAEVFLAASATVRRKSPAGSELTSAIPLIRCAKFGAEQRNSDPNIGISVNGLARDHRMITLANPVGLYIAAFDGAGVTLDGAPAGHFFQVTRGEAPLGLRAVFAVPPELATAGKTVSDVKIGGTPITFGGQLAQRVTMHLVGVASVAQPVNNAPAACGEIPQVSTAQALAGPPLFTRTAQ